MATSWSRPFRRLARRPFRPLLEALEARLAPATFTVTSPADAGPGTLRQAILDANGAAGADVIEFAPGVTGTINLAGALPNLSDDLELRGPGADRVTVRRDTGGNYRLLSVLPGVSASVAGLTLANGLTNGDGGAVANAGDLTLLGCVLVDSSGELGGAVHNTGTLTVAGSTFARNLARNGGAIDNGGTLTVRDSTFAANTAFFTDEGGGTGGAVRNLNVLVVRNSTFSGNLARFDGGGIGQVRGSAELVNVTITDNHSDVNDNELGRGGGLAVQGGDVTLWNALIAGNFRGSGTGLRDDVSGRVVSRGHNLVGAGDGSNGLTGPGDLVGSRDNPLDPVLGPLADNGGPTQTHALLRASPALDAGDDAVLAAPTLLTTDQRGLPRRIDGPDAGTESRVDVGAFENNPRVQDIADQVTLEDTPLTFSFHAGDLDIDAVTATSNNLALVPNANLAVSPPGAFRTLTITPARNRNGSATVTVTVAAGGRTFADTFVLTVVPVNDRPSFTASNQTVSEDAGPQTVPGWATLQPGPANESGQRALAYAVTAVGNPGLFAAPPSVAPDGTLTYTPAPGANGSSTFTLVVQDDGGTANGGVDTSLPRTFTITVTEVNDPPDRTGGDVADLTVAEDSGATTLGLDGLTYGPGGADEAGQALSFTVLQVPPAALGEVLRANGTPVAAGTSLTLAQLRALRFRPAPDAVGSAPFAFAVTDDDPDPQTLTETLTVTVTEVNDRPALVAGTVANLTLAANAGVTSLGLGAVTYGPGGGPDEAGQTLSYTVTAVPPASLGDVLRDDGSVVTAGAALTLAELRGLQFRPAGGGVGTARLRFTVTDDGTTDGQPDPRTLNQSLAVTVTPAVNRRPMLDTAADLFLEPVAEDDLTNAGTRLTLLLSGNPISDPDADALRGIALVGVATANGTWEVSFNDGATWQPVGPVSETAALLLDADPVGDNPVRLRFLPGPDFNGTVAPAITFRAWDQTSGVNGGIADTTDPNATAFSAEVETADLVVTEVNDVPVRTAGAVADLAVREDSGVTGLGFAGLAFGPGGGPDEATQVLTYTVTQLPAAGLGRVVRADGVTAVTVGEVLTPADLQGLAFRTAANGRGQGTFAFAVTDDGTTAGQPDPQTRVESLRLTVTAVNDAPDFTGSDQEADEDAGPQSVPGWATFDAGPNNERSQGVAAYRVANLTNAGLFTAPPAVAPDGTLTYTPAPNASGTATFEVVVQDDGGTADGGADTSLPQTFTITVNAVADPPDLTATDAAGGQRLPVALAVAAGLADADGSEVLGPVLVRGVPAGAAFNRGTDLGGGVWQFAPGELAGLAATFPDEGTFTLTVTASATETSNGCRASTTALFRVAVTFVPGRVSGAVFVDCDVDGVRDDEAGVPGRTVYLDANRNGRLDAGEPTTTTDASGAYAFAGLAEGAYQVRALFDDSCATVTGPPGGAYDISIVSGSDVRGRDFGAVPHSPIVPAVVSPTPFAPAQDAADRAFVAGLYQSLLGRGAAPPEVDLWVTPMRGGLSRGEVARLIRESAEQRGRQLDCYYRGFLGREADPEGKACWLHLFQQGATEEQVVIGFLTSAEYEAVHRSDGAFVEGLYRDLLGRPGEAAGMSHWLGELARGLTRAELVCNFVNAREARVQVVDGYYAAYLRRCADVEGRECWLHLLAEWGSAGLGHVATQFLGSDEYLLRATASVTRPV